jgi:serine/threonine protein kinase
MAPEAIAPTQESLQQYHESKANGEKDCSYSMKIGRASDIWSLGCILYQMIYTKPPFAALSMIQKLTAIPNPKYEINYPAHLDIDAIETIKSCLQRDAKARPPITGDSGLLNKNYLKIPFQRDEVSFATNSMASVVNVSMNSSLVTGSSHGEREVHSLRRDSSTLLEWNAHSTYTDEPDRGNRSITSTVNNNEAMKTSAIPIAIFEDKENNVPFKKEVAVSHQLRSSKEEMPKKLLEFQKAKLDLAKKRNNTSNSPPAKLLPVGLR